MQFLALPGFAAFFFVALWVGVRLLAQWGRSRELPELLLGLGVLGIGPVGFGFLMLAAASGASDPHAPSVLAGVSAIAVAGGAASKAIFNWRIYHPASRGAAMLCFGAIAANATAVVADAITTGFAPASWMQPGWALVRQAVQIAVLLWGAGEAFVWWRRMQRRVHIGLGDPVVASRFLFWSIGAGAAGTGSLVGTFVGLVEGKALDQLPELTLGLSLFGSISAIALWLAFATPAWLEARLRS